MILVGALLLTLPFASRSGESVGFFTALFTATSATCVTGLVVADTFLTWSPFGQGVILLLIQLGGLGFMTVITLISFAFHRRIGLSERLIMVSTLNLDDLDGVVRVVRHALMGTAFFELCGAALLSLRMIPRYGLFRGLWHALFHAVSAFCNAGFDLQGGDTGAFSSLAGFADDPVVLLTTSALVIIGGLGFFVWEDIYKNRSWKKLTLYSKLVLTITAFLLFGGALFFFFSEGNNPATLGGMPLWEKWLNAFFQSMTLRTAGFNVIDQGAMTDNSLVMSCILMLIGGSSGSTAGGMKTVTIWVLFMVLFTSLRGRETITFRGRSVSARRAMNAVTLFLMVLLLFLGGSMLISLTHQTTFLHAAFETASALGTVGLTAGLTPTLARPAQILLIVLMYTGRVGVLSFSIAFLTRRQDSLKIQYPEFRIMIG
ncbi:MAG: potassium uptake protein, TrkH family [Oscillospiraceae bacterium]|nr:potassium uptake protein, TrkH family [Oscillospiraceae bacterium]